MRKFFSYSIILVLLVVVSVQANAQFDDLYYDPEDFETRTQERITYDEVQTESVGYTSQDEYSFDEDEYDEYDEYIDYYANDYEIDAYQYTNRLNRYRLSIFTSAATWRRRSHCPVR